MRDPQRQQMRRQPQSVRLLIGVAREVLQAHERGAASADHQLPGVGRTHAHHHIEIDRTIGLEHILGARQGFVGDAADIDVLQQAEEVAAVRPQRLDDHLLRVR